jgi:hypothetical protein
VSRGEDRESKVSTADEPAKARSLRIRPGEVLERLAAGERVLFLDARSEKAWGASAVKLPGARRIRPLLLKIEPDWDRNGLVVIYCA